LGGEHLEQIGLAREDQRDDLLIERPARQRQLQWSIATIAIALPGNEVAAKFEFGDSAADRVTNLAGRDEVTLGRGNAMKIEEIHRVAYRCKDAKQTVEFYSKVLDMDLIGAIAEDSVPSTKSPDPSQFASDGPRRKYAGLDPAHCLPGEGSGDLGGGERAGYRRRA